MTRHSGRLLSLFLILALALAPALVLTSCGVQDDTPGTDLPTVPGGNGGIDFDPPDVTGGLSITPGDTTYSAEVAAGGCADFSGQHVYYWALGGTPPYTWSNSQTDTGRITPIDEAGDATWRKVKYEVKVACIPKGNYNDVLIVRDHAGATASVDINFNVTEEGQPEEETPTTLAITPSTATGGQGDVLTFVATGGSSSPIYEWYSSNPTRAALSSTVGKTVNVTLNATGLTADATVTLTVTEGDQIATATITILAPTP